MNFNDVQTNFIASRNNFIASRQNFITSRTIFIEAPTTVSPPRQNFIASRNNFNVFRQMFVEAQAGFNGAQMCYNELFNQLNGSRTFDNQLQETPMPITTVASYPITAEQFINHWNQVNTFLGLPANALTLVGGYTVANFTTDRTALMTAITAVVAADNVQTNTASDRDIKKAALRVRITQFRGLVSGLMMGSIYVRSLPTMPNFSTSEGAYLRPLDDMQNLWTQINASPPTGFTAPLLLAGGYTLATFTTDVAALKTAYTTANDAAQNATIARSGRDVLLAPLRARMQQYRKSVVGKLPPGNLLLNTIPAYSPHPGSTPDPVSASGHWDAVQSVAVINWTASPNPNLLRYELRIAPGPVYRVKDETTVDLIDSDVLFDNTTAGLAASGAVALYRVYVILITGNEKGSATVKITRP